MAKDYRREVLCYGKYEGSAVPMSISVSGSVEVSGAAGCMIGIEALADEALTSNNFNSVIVVT